MIDRRIKMRHLTAFMEFARHPSIIAAADSLGMTQPAASKTLAELEQLAGQRLFDRSKAGIALTAAGKVLLHYTGQGLGLLQDGLEELKAGHAPQSAMLRIGALPTVAASLMPQAVQQVRALGPHVLVRVVTGTNDALLQALLGGELDVMVGRMAAADGMAGLTFEHLYSERVVFVVRAGHPLLGPGLVPHMLRGFECLLPGPGSIIRPSVDRFLLAAGIASLPHCIETVSDSFGRAFVVSSDAVWAISRGVVENDIRDGTLAALPFDTGDTSGPVGLTLRAGARPAEPVTLFMQCARQAAQARRLE